MNGSVRRLFTLFVLLLVAGCNTMQTRSGENSVLSRIQQRGRPFSAPSCRRTTDGHIHERSWRFGLRGIAIADHVGSFRW